jgi:hypothetical protein
MGDPAFAAGREGFMPARARSPLDGGTLAEQALRGEVAERLRGRKGEAVSGLLARLSQIAGDDQGSDHEYLENQRLAVAAALDYLISSVEMAEDRWPPVPPVLVTQARLAACNGVGLDTVLRRYFAGFTLFAGYVLQEAEEVSRRTGISLHRFMQLQTAQFDQFVTTICEEYTSEREKWLRSSSRRQAEQVEQLLYGESVDPSSLPIEFSCWHVGLLARGSQAAEALQDAASTLDLRLFLVRPGNGILWGWLQSQRPPDLPEIHEELKRNAPESAVIAIGEAGEGLPGWRGTHQQARACLPVAVKGNDRVVRYSQVGLIAALMQDELLIASLRQRYLHPLADGREGGNLLRETLRAYLTAERNVSSTAAALGISRSTVNNRLRTIEKRLGQPLGACILQLEAALQLEELSEVDKSTEYAPVH